ncbi:hypothetical protein H310_07614 [Aphanomyces invadans]|uniref:Protein transport protein sec16 n=1 Tax=Aphanomyces invadans TaxID=157072 RepID=A0A024U2U0_9STRA|nr:hypothetical protein H310_07614 [Aphanomyces invadans]ETW00222.1 hypothetical protein H310_07614 [Aphanomyces invadans]|eukprot:XP_008871247.1 hypothetical protein H310_07614 [Aphanomyces invadans]
MEGQGVRSLYGPPSHTESEGWEVVDQEERAPPHPSSVRQPLSINPHADVNKPQFPARLPNKNAIPSRVVDDLLAQHHMIHGTSAILDLDADADDNAGGAWGTDSPSNLLGSDEMDYDDEASPTKAQNTQTSAWKQQVDEFSPREPPAGAFGDDDLDLDEDEDDQATAAPSRQLSPPPSPVAAAGPSFNFNTSSPFSQSAEAPEGAFGDDDLKLDDEEQEPTVVADRVEEAFHQPIHAAELYDSPEIHTFPAAPVYEVPELNTIPVSPHDARAFGDDLDFEDQHEEPTVVADQIDEAIRQPLRTAEHFDSPDVLSYMDAPVDAIPALHTTPVSPHDAPPGAFGDDDLDVDLDIGDEDDVEDVPVAPEHPAAIVSSSAETEVPELSLHHIDTSQHAGIDGIPAKLSPEESPRNRDSWSSEVAVTPDQLPIPSHHDRSPPEALLHAPHRSGFERSYPQHDAPCDKATHAVEESVVEGSMLDLVDAAPNDSSPFYHCAEAAEPEDCHTFDAQRNIEIPLTQPPAVEEMVEEPPEAVYPATHMEAFGSAVARDPVEGGGNDVALLNQTHAIAAEHRHEPADAEIDFHYESVEAVANVDEHEVMDEASPLEQYLRSSPLDSTPETSPSPFTYSPERVVEASVHVEGSNDGYNHAQQVSAPEVHATPPSSRNSGLHASPEVLEATYEEQIDASPFDHHTTHDPRDGFFVATNEEQAHPAAVFAPGHGEIDVIAAAPPRYDEPPTMLSLLDHRHNHPTSGATVFEDLHDLPEFHGGSSHPTAIPSSGFEEHSHVPEFDAPTPSVCSHRQGHAYEARSPLDQHHEEYSEASPLDLQGDSPHGSLAPHISSPPGEFGFEQHPQEAPVFSEGVVCNAPEKTADDDRPHAADGLFGALSGHDACGAPPSAFDTPVQHEYHEQFNHGPANSCAQDASPTMGADELFSSSPDFGFSAGGAFDSTPPPPTAFAGVVAHFSNPTDYHSAPHLAQHHGEGDFFSTGASVQHDMSSQFHSVGHAADLFGGQGSYSNDPFGDPFTAPAPAASHDHHSADDVFAQEHAAAVLHEAVPCGHEQYHHNFPPPIQTHQKYSTPFEVTSSTPHSLEQPIPSQHHTVHDNGRSMHAEIGGHGAAYSQAAPLAASNSFSEPASLFEQSSGSADSFFGHAPVHFATEPVASSSEVVCQQNETNGAAPEENFGYNSHCYSEGDQMQPDATATSDHHAEVAHSANQPVVHQFHQDIAVLPPEIVHPAPPPPDHHSLASTTPHAAQTFEDIDSSAPPMTPSASIPQRSPPSVAAKNRPTLQVEDDEVPTADSLFSPTNGNEISNVFGSSSAFDQPPSSLGGFSNAHAATLFSRHASSGADAFAAPPTFQAYIASSNASGPNVNAVFEAPSAIATEAFPSCNTSAPEACIEAPADDLFAGSSSSLFDQHQAFTSQSSEPFGQAAHQHEPAAAAQVFGNYTESSSHQYAPSRPFHQPEARAYGAPVAAAPCAPSYSRPTSHASGHCDETPTSHAYAQQGYSDQYGYGNHATAAAFNQGPVSYDAQATAQGYDAQYNQQHGAYVGYAQRGASQQPAYHQPVAQTFDQPAPPSYPQVPGHGFSHPGYSQQTQYHPYDQYNQQGVQQYGHPHGFNQADVRPAKPAIFKPQPAPAQPVAYEQHVPRMSRELKQQYQPTTPTPQAAPAVFNPAPKPQAGSQPKDPSVVPRTCLATFGFGGTVCVMFPRRKLKLLSTGHRNSPRTPHGSVDEHIDDSRKGPLDFYKLDRVHHESDAFYQKVWSFPGPLGGPSSTTDDAILKYMGSHVSLHEDERLLWDLMQVFVKSKGKISTRDAKASDILLMQVLQNALARRSNSLPPYDPVSPTAVHAPSFEGTEVATNAKIRQLLLDGDRKAAIDTAVAANMWSQAMLLASFVDSGMYKAVVERFVTSRYGAGDPLRTMLMVFGDLDVASVQEPSTPSPSSLLGNWLAQVQILIANPTATTNKVLIELGDRLLRETRNVWAAHVCYLLAGMPLEAPSPTARMTLIGGHATGDVRFFVRPNTVQWTEVYEHVVKATPMVPFQGYKFIYATLLADAGCCDVAFKYVDAMRKTLEQWTVKLKMPSSPYLDNLKMQLDVFDDRLRFFMGQENVDAVEVQVSKKGGLFSSLTGFLDMTLDKIVNDTPPPPAKAVSAPLAGAAFAPHMFPPAPGSNHSQPPGSHNSRAPNSSSSTYQQHVQPAAAPTSQSHGYAHNNGIASSPGSHNTPSPGSQHGQDASGLQHGNSSSWNDAPPSSISQPPSSTNAAAMLPPRAPSATTASAPPSAQPHAHPPLKKSSSFTMEAKAHAETSPTTKDDSTTPKAKTPPTSTSQKKSSGWGFPSLSLPSLGLVDMLRRSADPVGDATVAKVGKDMEAYYCEEKKRWVFPGEEDAEDLSGPPPPPPTSFAAAAQAPAPDAAASNDPLAALMAPPPMKETTPLAAMMAPPARNMYGSQRGGAAAAKRTPPRPQFAVFKPSAAATPAPSSEDAAPSSGCGPSSMPPPSSESPGGQ